MQKNSTNKELSPQDLWLLQVNLTPLERAHALDYLLNKSTPIDFTSLVSHCCSSREKQKKLLQNYQLLPNISSTNEPHLFTRAQFESTLSKKIPHPNLLAIQYLGNPEILNSPKIAIIGSRRPTLYGREQAYRFAKELALKGCTIVSGGAIGIDTTAQAVGLQYGKSCCVLGNGLLNPYPPSNTQLFLDLKKSIQGLILSEFCLRECAQKWNFPQRNITIASMADFVLVIEATLTSGSLITAHAACELGIDVGAIPGSIDSINSVGCHELIKNGAFCIQKPQDILQRIKINN
ncbi:DNA-processing protein DprA [Fluviispira vulneris]|uniref:DNA-processing protein DprA n=1 Tax=Fluviispira vulneris TaxID=2763012 RepID=UPI0016440F38|nr:DNA-processing protein DprA [Fluviispira vulneris]